MAQIDSNDPEPLNKMISNYPRPISPRRAKYEAERARYHGWELPRGHPYYHVHPGVPYLPAKLISRVTSLFTW